MQHSSLVVRLVLVGTVVCCIVGILAIFASRAHTSYANDIRPVPTVTVQAQNAGSTFVISHPQQTTTIQGIPAAPAHTDGTQLTVDDIHQYVEAATPPPGPTVAGNAPTVVSITLMTSKQASQQLGNEWIGLPDNENVYLIVLKGPFQVTNVSVPPGETAPSSIDQIYEVLDAHTGNRVLWGDDA